VMRTGRNAERIKNADAAAHRITVMSGVARSFGEI